MRSALYALSLLVGSSLCGRRLFVRAGQVNITLDDTDPSIVYQPASAWFFNGNTSGCAVCLTPPNTTIAYKGTWHHGIHVIPIFDEDDSDGKDPDNPPGKKNRRLFPRDTPDDNYDPNNGATASPFFTVHLDADDPGFADTPVTFQLNFTGTAVYLYGILALGVPPNTNATPTLTNLTFTLDGQPAGNFIHNGSAQSGGFQGNSPVFSQGGLENSPHSLEGSLGDNSVFLLDYYVFSQEDGSNFNSPTSSSDTPPAPSPSAIGASTSNSSSKHNVDTFAGAVGGSVGVLAVVASCLAFSIFRRRQLSQRRERQEQRQRSDDAESFHTDISEDGPPMRGPTTFVPRYFPGTVPVAPPPYIPSSNDSALPSTSSDGTRSLSSYPVSVPTTFRPTTALLAPDRDGMESTTDSPPPFVVAIASPEPPLMANVRRVMRAPPGIGLPLEEERSAESVPILSDPEPHSRPPSAVPSRTHSARPTPVPSIRAPASIADGVEEEPAEELPPRTAEERAMVLR